MDSSMPSGLINKEQCAYIENTLSELERNHLNNRRTELIVSGVLNPAEDVQQGAVWHRKVEVIRSNTTTSVFKRFISHFTAEGRKQRQQNREAAALFCRQVWVLLENDKTSVDLKKRIINNAESGALPFLKKTEIKTIIRNKEIILRGTKECELIRNASGFLKKELPNMMSRLPRVTVEDSREVLKAYYQLIILSPELLPKGHKAHKAIRKLAKHLRNTRQAVDITELKTNIARSVFHNLWEVLPSENYQRLLISIESNPGSSRDKVLQNVQDLIISNANPDKPFVHGHPRELVSVSDLALVQNSPSLRGYKTLNRLLEDLSDDESAVRHRINQLPRELRSLDLAGVKQDFDRYESLRHSLSAENQTQDFKELEARCQAHRRLIAEGRAALLDIQLYQGRRWTLNLLLQILTNSADRIRNEDKLPDLRRDQLMFQKLLDLDQLRGPQVDAAQLEWLIAQNNKTRGHLTVAIEGDGPTGLMLAFTQFQEGANVTVFEKRGTEDNRLPVVRLDPQWLHMLKFYLGEEYYRLFGEDGQGIVRADGFGEVFGEIATDRLQEALNLRLAELMRSKDEHTSRGNDPQNTRLERLAAYEMTEVEISKQGFFTVQAQYNPENDPTLNGQKKLPADYQKPQVLSRPVDLVICAGGKNSQFRNLYMEDKMVSSARSYGVCNWEGSKDQPLNNERLDTFGNFRGMVIVDQQFQQFFQDQMTSEVDRIEGLSPYERRFLSQQTHERSRGVRRLQASAHGRVMQTRCFENKNLVSIGMELPEAFNEFCQKLQKKLAALPVQEFDQKGEKRSAADQQAWRDQRAARVQKALATAWFQTVAHSYGIDQSLGATRETINHASSAVFPIQLHKARESVISKRSDSHEVVIAAAGEAAASDHFMTAGNLAGARENMLHLQSYTRVKCTGFDRLEPKLKLKFLSGKMFPFLKTRLQLLEEAQWETGKCVIKRGEALLVPVGLKRP
ncbi:hypothetical protein ACTL6P_09470 [Endozoicomonas acroporae]|uniref:hypothetical protein n=1 Tax=Endozoicomonas acroporae TaxID=1701104 RepID=UPI000C75C415|nr:hypothetical protein [Endozoicomonas acroporae]